MITCEQQVMNQVIRACLLLAPCAIVLASNVSTSAHAYVGLMLHVRKQQELFFGKSVLQYN